MQQVEFKSKARLIISKEVLAQVSYLHHKVGNIEWSGLVFYKIVSGDINDPATLVLKAERVYLMDIGSAAYTEFSPDESIVDFYQKYPEALTMKWGMLHTHHDMEAFFSGTDTEELKSNAGAHNFYLSLIVNFRNGGNFCAKIGIIADIEVETKYKFSHGLSFKGLEDSKPTLDKQLLTINCVIEYELDTFDFDRYDSIRKAKTEAEAVKKVTSFNRPSFPTPSNQLNLGAQFGEGFGKSNPYIPKTVSEIESYLSKALSLDTKTADGLKEVLDHIKKEQKQYGEAFDLMFWDAFDFGLNTTYYAVFGDTLEIEHHNAFFKQCIMCLDKYRLSGYPFYDKIIDIFDMYIDVDEPADFAVETKKTPKIHKFSNENQLSKAIAGKDKAFLKLKKGKKDGK